MERLYIEDMQGLIKASQTKLALARVICDALGVSGITALGNIANLIEAVEAKAKADARQEIIDAISKMS